eukprot:COSAG01_NODE_50730_length_361_cov_0.557252_1_plen_64_part_01
MSADPIKVGIRARPFFREKGQARAWNTNGTSLVPNKAADGSTTMQYDFDHVWDEEVPDGARTIH